MYHYVRARDAIDGVGVRGITPEGFERQLDRFAHELEPIDWPRLREWLDGNAPISGPSFLLTFDDGLTDHREVVLPILRRRAMRGLFFVSGRTLAERKMLDAHAVHLLLSVLGDHRLRVELLHWLDQHGEGTNWWDRIDEDQAVTRWHYEPRERALIKHFLMEVCPPQLRHCALEALFEQHVGPVSEWADRWYMSRDDCAALEAEGHAIGSHGYSHEPLAGLSPAQKRIDLHQVAALLGGPGRPTVPPLSYPYGSFDDDTLSACRETGYTYAFTTRRAWVTRRSGSLQLPRVDTLYADTFLREQSRCLE